jgi:hypothetical protein
VPERRELYLFRSYPEFPPYEAVPRSRLARARDSVVRRRRLVVEVALVYLTSRLLTLLGVLIVLLVRPKLGFMRVLAYTWDAGAYMITVKAGYPHAGPITAPHTQNGVAAFFPLYPGAISLTSRVFGLPIEGAAVLVSFLAGGVAAVLVAIIAARVFDVAVARRTAVLFAFAPGALVFSLAYSEGLMLMLSAACLLFLLQRRWLLGGVAAALATATRPNAVVLVVCCAVAAGEAILRRYDWRSIVAPLLAPLGAVVYFAFLYRRTHSVTYWFDVERIIWHDHVDPGVHLWNGIVDFVEHPLHTPVIFLFGISVIVGVALLVVMLRTSMPAVLKVFAIGVLVVAALSHVLYPNPRFILTAFPLTIALAARVKGPGYAVLVAASAAAMVLLVVLYCYGFSALSTRPMQYFPAP